MLSKSFPSSFFTPKSSLFLFVVIAIVVSTISTIPISEAKLLSTIIKLFDTPHSMLLDQQQVMYATTDLYLSGHRADKTRQFLAFGDAALDYYIN
mmetsp:Transcript_27060/g.29148  ORF Transcript_27060/g.29148 Transcript_27060/m.29148 type:complete len:95 (-) Transcript_27060:217-501(-)